MKPENPASSLFFLPRKSWCLLLHFQAFSPDASANSAPVSLPSPHPFLPKNLEGQELLAICSPRSCSPGSGPQQLKCRDQFLEKSWRRWPCSCTRNSQPARQGQHSQPVYSRSAVTEFAGFLSCTFQGFPLLHRQSSCIPTLWNLHFGCFKETLGFLIALHSFFP